MSNIVKIDSPGAFALAIKSARETLEKCRDFGEAKEIRDHARALQVYARAKEDGVAAQNAAAAVVLKAEALMGKMTREVPRQTAAERGAQKARATVHGLPPTTDALGLDRKERQRYEELAEADDAGVLDEYIAEAQATGERITRQAALERAKPHVSRNTGNNEWYTPPDYIEAARVVLGEIDLDPASSAVANKTVKAKRYYDVQSNGLDSRKRWKGRVWMNPPYAQPLIGEFCERVASEYEAGNIEAAIVLVNNGTETKWGQRLLLAASAVCFPSGRIRFIDAEGNPGGAPLQGQMVVYLGKKVAAFRKAFADKGVVCER